MPLRRFALLAFSVALPAIAAADIQPLSARDAHIKVQRGELILIDVRTPSEWAVTGLPQDSVGATLQNRDFIQQAYGAVYGDRDHPIALICSIGDRSETAARQLEAEGFTQIYNVTEGMSGREGEGTGWLEQELPTYNYIPRN